MKPNEEIKHIVYNLMNHGYSEEHARDLIGEISAFLLKLPPEKLYILRAAHEQRMKEQEEEITEQKSA